LIVGFNSEGFDVPVIEGLMKRKLRLKEHFDIFLKLKLAIRRVGGPLKGNRLHDVGLRTVGRGKSGDGAHAPQLANEGRWAELFQYCMNDVHLTHDIFTFIRRNGGINDSSGNLLELDVLSWMRLEEECLKDATGEKKSSES
jgi:DEAD/DEAH box helicase domain-containing protein